MFTCENSSSPPLLLSSQSDVLRALPPPPPLGFRRWFRCPELIKGNSRWWRFRLMRTSTRSYGVRKLAPLCRRTLTANTRCST